MIRRDLSLRLERLEIKVRLWQARQALEALEEPGRDVFGEILTRYGIRQEGQESVAEAVARGAGISCLELKDLLWKRANRDDA
jgi:hypothetical protein